MPAERQGRSVPRYAVGLYRISTAEQGQSGLGLEAQQAAVRAFCASQGWVLVCGRPGAAGGGGAGGASPPPGTRASRRG
jgi:hypothetical protein